MGDLQNNSKIMDFQEIGMPHIQWNDRAMTHATYM